MGRHADKACPLCGLGGLGASEQPGLTYILKDSLHLPGEEQAEGAPAQDSCHGSGGGLGEGSGGDGGI